MLVIILHQKWHPGPLWSWESSLEEAMTEQGYKWGPGDLVLDGLQDSFKFQNSKALIRELQYVMTPEGYTLIY